MAEATWTFDRRTAESPLFKVLDEVGGLYGIQIVDG